MKFGRRTLPCWCFCAGLFCLNASAQKPELVVQTGHSNGVRSVAFSPDGRTLASGSDDHTIKLWDVASGRKLRTFAVHSRYLNSVAFSPDGRTLASGSDGHTIKLWDAASGRELRTLTGHTNFVESVAFSPDGRTLASGSDDQKVKLWDVASGRELRTLAGHTSAVYSVAFNPDGRTLASGSPDGTVKLWDVASGRKLRTLTGHKGEVRSVAFSPDGRTLASGSDDFTVKLWDAASGRELRTLAGHTDRVTPVAFSPDGRTVASGSADFTVKLWDAASGQELRTLAGHTKEVWSVAFSPDGRTLASGSDDHTVKLWDGGSGRELRTLAGHTGSLTSVAFSPDGRTLASGSDDSSSAASKLSEGFGTIFKITPAGTVKLWRAASGGGLRTLMGHTDRVNSVAFSPDGRTLASGSFDRTVKLWDVASGRELRTLAGHTSFVNSVAFSLDGSTLASGSFDSTVKLWDAASGRELLTLTGHTLGVNSVAFSPDGGTLASGSDDHTIKLWDVASGRELRTLSGHNNVVTSVAFSPDGRTLASGSRDATIKLWDAASGRELRTQPGLTAPVLSIAFSPDGRTLASGSVDHTVKLWDIASVREPRTLTGHTDFVESVIFSPDGRTLASGSDDHTIKLWDVASGRELASLFTLDQSDWVVSNPEGRFDTNNLDEIKGLSWVFPDEPFRALAPEIFMRDYYEPRLLPRLLAGEEIPKVRQLQDLNRVQPQVDVLKVEPEARGSLVSVTVQVTGAQSAVQKDSSGKLLHSGAYDLRLFRDGQLVDQWPEAGTSAGSLPGAREAELESWRKLHQIDLIDGRYTRTFSGIRLSQVPGVDKVEFTAYAFNSDRVKSLTTPPYEYKLRNASQGKAVSRRAYLITMGVNANQSHNLNLELAVSSAERARTLLHSKLRADYGEVVEIPLYSDLAPDSEQTQLNLAKKADLKAILDLLAGREVDPKLREEVDAKHQLQAATPDDAVVLYVASHGYADPEGTFYLMPSNTGTNWGTTEYDLTQCQSHPDQSTRCEHARDLLGHSVSSSELAAWWNGVDGGEMVMILDSCHSGAAPGRKFRPGPLGDPGFGQLSYDKGMQILSASQPAQTEKGEWVTGGEGRTLLLDALETLAAQNPRQNLTQWLHGVEEQLPRTAQQLYPGLKEDDAQVPILLDFRKKPNSTLPKIQ